MGGNAGECRSLTSFRGRTRFPLVLKLLLSFNINYDGITVLMLPLSFNIKYDFIKVLKQSANRAIILAKLLSYAPRAEFRSFKSVALFFVYI